MGPYLGVDGAIAIEGFGEGLVVSVPRETPHEAPELDLSRHAALLWGIQNLAGANVNSSAPVLAAGSEHRGAPTLDFKPYVAQMLP